jgi:hypothetical protein
MSMAFPVLASGPWSQQGQRFLRLRPARMVRIRFDPEHHTALCKHDASGYR